MIVRVVGGWRDCVSGCVGGSVWVCKPVCIYVIMDWMGVGVGMGVSVGVHVCVQHPLTM